MIAACGTLSTMAREIPEVVRAAAGLAATVLDEARRLPTTLPGLPVRLIGQALQTSLHLQQQYSGLVARGDEVLTGLRGAAEPGLATFDEDEDETPARPPARPATAGRGSAFDRVADLDDDLDGGPQAGAAADTALADTALADTALADEALADDLAGADLPVADPDDLSDEVAAVLAASTDDTVADLTPAEIAALPDDPAADAVTAAVDELATEVADEVAAEVPDVVPDEVLEELTADTVSGIAEDQAEDQAEDEIEEAVADGLIAEPAVPGTPAAEVVAAGVSTLADLTAEPAPAEVPGQTRIVDDAVPDVPALDDATEELVDLGGPEAAESVTPGSDVTDSAASDPLVPVGDGAPASPIEGYDDFSIPALRGRLRAYPTETVADLLDYERATRARVPYVTLLQNRLEKLSADRG